MARTLGWAVLVAALAVSCRCAPSDDLPTDPARRKALVHLGDGRALVRITAMRELAPKASRYETYAIAKAAKNENEDVRREAALALGKAPVPEAVDLLGEFLRDPLDGVREAAIVSLAGRHDPKADAYVASAWEKGGPRTRAAIAETNATILGKALALEAAARKERVDRVLHADFRRELEKATKERRIAGIPHPDAQVKASALEELGRSGTAEGVAELAARLAGDDPVVAAGAALGLARARAQDQVPALVSALGSPDVLVANAAAMALGELAPEKASDALVNALGRHDPLLSSSVLEALEPVALTPDQRAKVCEAARQTQNAAVATALHRRAGPNCAVLPELPDEAPAQGQKWLVLAALGPRMPALLEKARAALVSPDATLAASAAAYLALWGEPSDGQLLRKAAEDELTAMDAGREREVRQNQANREEADADRKEHVEAMRQVLAMSGKAADLPTDNALEAILKKKAASSDSLTRPARTGSVELVAAAGAGAARLGTEVTALGERLFASPQARLQMLAVDVADLGGPAYEGLREKIRTSDDAELRTTMLLRDFDSGRANAFERLLQAGRPPESLRARVTAALATRPVQAKEFLLAAVDAQDAGTAPALRALGKVPGKEAEAALATSVLSTNPGFALAAVEALAGREGPEADAALAKAAAYPDGVVRQTALEALANRHACREATHLGALAGDYEVRVRVAAQALAAACPAPPP